MALVPYNRTPAAAGPSTPQPLLLAQGCFADQPSHHPDCFATGLGPEPIGGLTSRADPIDRGAEPAPSSGIELRPGRHPGAPLLPGVGSMRAPARPPSRGAAAPRRWFDASSGPAAIQGRCSQAPAKGEVPARRAPAPVPRQTRAPRPPPL
ncbi:hypothetical protein PAHAL_2G371600 [Panicum hallii]|uniref:Uncharacterized protein n=1 Tax=Panicum hallii TaxID=206008 RepID=A0A2S3H0V8_9POAL|nr:hypothetical protein PAHAL_2G371600 [Panicum hallii]